MLGTVHTLKAGCVIEKCNWAKRKPRLEAECMAQEAVLELGVKGLP